MDNISHYARIERAIRFIEDNRLEQPSLDRVAAGVGMSAFHLQRVFTAWAGVSPKLFLRYVTLDHAREALMDARPVLDAALDVGLSGPGRLHDLFVTLEAATPGEVGAGGRGLDIRYGRHDGPFGRFLVAATERGVCRIAFEQEGENPVEALADAWPNARLAEDEAHTWRIAGEALAHGIDGGDSPIRLWARGTNFQIKVWEALLRVPAGRLVSYGGLALANSVATGLEMLLLLLLLGRKVRKDSGEGTDGEVTQGLPVGELLTSGGRSTLAAAVMAGGVLFWLTILPESGAIFGIPAAWFAAFTGAALGVVIYVLASFLLGGAETRQLWALARKRRANPTLTQK